MSEQYLVVPLSPAQFLSIAVPSPAQFRSIAFPLNPRLKIHAGDLLAVQIDRIVNRNVMFVMMRRRCAADIASDRALRSQVAHAR
jgi:hypothetical protein